MKNKNNNNNNNNNGHVKNTTKFQKAKSMTVKTTEMYTSESDLHSYEITNINIVTNIAQKNSEAPMGFEPMTSHNTGAMLYQLSYEASLEAGQVRVQFIPVIMGLFVTA